MNKRQLEVQKHIVEEEKGLIERLKKTYAEARRECNHKIRELAVREDMGNIQSIVYQKQYQEALKRQLDSALDDLNAKSFSTIADYLSGSYENGFFGTLYDLQGQGIPLLFPINHQEVIQALKTDSKLSEGMYKRLGENTIELKKSIRAELSRGISGGASWGQIAVFIASGMGSSFSKAYNNSIRIARTEGHRIQNEAAFHCQQKAKKRGADIVKQWDATLDSQTRPHHLELNGQVRKTEEPFEVAGLTAMYPGGFGIAAEDCNCRCCLLQRAKWAITEDEYFTKWNGDRNELVEIKAKDYNKFKESAKSRLLRMQFPTDVYKIKGMTLEIKEELENALLKLKGEYDIRLNSISVEKSGKKDIFIVGYHDGIMDMVVNENADFDMIVKRIPEYYRKGRFAGKSLEDYIAHEAAHVMLYQDCITDSAYKAKYEQIETLYGSLKGVSGYADRTKSGNEALAEAFVRVRNNEKVAPIVKILVESYYGKWKK